MWFCSDVFIYQEDIFCVLLKTVFEFGLKWRRDIMKKKSLYARCEVARAMVRDRRAFAPRVVQSKKRKVERKPWRAYLEA